MSVGLRKAALIAAGVLAIAALGLHHSRSRLEDRAALIRSPSPSAPVRRPAAVLATRQFAIKGGTFGKRMLDAFVLSSSPPEVAFFGNQVLSLRRRGAAELECWFALGASEVRTAVRYRVGLVDLVKRNQASVLTCAVPQELVPGLLGEGPPFLNLTLGLAAERRPVAAGVLASLALYRSALALPPPRRHRLAATTMFKDARSCGRGFEACLVEWLEWHRLLGFTQFFFYDNGSGDGSAAQLEPYVRAGVATVVDWPVFLGGTDNLLAQRVQLNHAVYAFGRDVEWLGLFDLDEFVLPNALQRRRSRALEAEAPDMSADTRALEMRTAIAQHPDSCVDDDDDDEDPPGGGGVRLRMRDCPLRRKSNFGAHSKVMVHAGSGVPLPLTTPHRHPLARRGSASLVHFARKYGCVPPARRCRNKKGARPPECVELSRKRACVAAGRGEAEVLRRLTALLTERVAAIFACAPGASRDMRRLTTECLLSPELPSVAANWSLI